MGSKKFYETPAGKIRAELILNSGGKYDQASAEFRLAFLHYERRNEYNRRNDAQVVDLLMGIFFATGISKLTDDSRQKTMEYAREERERIYNMMSLMGKRPETEKEKREREANHLAGQQAYAEALAGLGKFNSLDQLNAAITALNETIHESAIQNNPSQRSADQKDGKK